MVELPGITEEGDNIKGFLNEDAVMGILKKMTAITKEDPVNIVDTIPY
jgi:hypothetical protein